MVERSPGEVYRAERREELRVRLAGCEPARELRTWLALYRDGRDGRSPTGASFTDVWELAVERACRARDGEAWREIFSEQRDAWRRAYERGPSTRGERALAALTGDPGRDHLVSGGDAPDDAPERVCAHCRGALGSMAGRSPKARFCSTRCARDAAYLRERAKAKASKRTRRNGSPSDIASEGGRVAVGGFG